MPYKDKQKQSDYQIRWMQARKTKWILEHGPCSCGSWDDLEVDHVDPSTKVSHRIWCWTEAKRELELSKCQVLCNACHLKKTLEQRPKAGHGTSSMYGYQGCRCDICTEAHRIAVADWRSRNG